MREWFSELIELVRRSVQFQPDQIANLHCLGQHRANVIQMREDALGIGIAFPAENFIAVDRESVEKILLLGSGFLDESRECGLEGLELPRMHFEIRMKSDEIRKRIHPGSLSLQATTRRVDSRVHAHAHTLLDPENPKSQVPNPKQIPNIKQSNQRPHRSHRSRFPR